MSATWGPEAVGRLTTMWEAGDTAQAIADAFGDGRTRNSIIGQAHKLGLQKRPVGGQRGRHPITREEAQAQRDAEIAAFTNRRRPIHALKAYSVLGDDTTLSRFVKVKGGHQAPRRKQWALPGFGRSNPAIDAGRSIFHAKGLKQPGDGNVLVSGHNNVKIGRDVRKGRLRGYWIFTVSLEERATCPTTCKHWHTCYGNHMPYARRVDHRDRARLEAAIERDVVRELNRRGRAGVLVRLHALGDFFDQDYVRFWAGLLARHERLAVYGYTAHLPGSAIGNAVLDLNRMFPGRAFMRHSDGGLDQDCTQSIRTVDQAVNAIVCPEQTGKTAACATCALCWSTRRNIAFLEH